MSLLFGSRAAGREGPLSDTDLAFLIDSTLVDEGKYPYGYQAYLTGELMKILSTCDVDVIILNEAPILLKFNIINRSQVVFRRSHKKWLDFYLKVFNEYQDFRPFIEVQNKYMVERIMNEKPR